MARRLRVPEERGVRPVLFPTPGSDRPGSATLVAREPVRFAPPSLQVDRCDGCLVCYYFCPDGAIDPGPPLRVVAEWCKGCNICVRECPRRALQSTAEGHRPVREAGPGGG